MIPVDRLDRMIEEARGFLKSSYLNQSELLTQRLANFDQINWTGFKETLIQQFESITRSNIPEEEARCIILQWLENTLTD